MFKVIFQSTLARNKERKVLSHSVIFILIFRATDDTPAPRFTMNKETEEQILNGYRTNIQNRIKQQVWRILSWANLLYDSKCPSVQPSATRWSAGQATKDIY